MAMSMLLKSWAIPPASRPIGLHLLRLPQLLLEHRFLADVDERDHRAGDGALVDDGVRPVLDPEALPVLAPEDLVVDVGLPAHAVGQVAPALAVGVGRPVGAGVVDQRVDVLAEQLLLAGVPEQAQAGRVAEGAESRRRRPRRSPRPSS